MKRRDFVKSLGWLGILSQLPRIKTPAPPPKLIPTNWKQREAWGSATAMAGSFSDTYTQQMIKSTRAMSRKIEENLFREI